VSQRLLDEAPHTGLRRFVGCRVNLFRAMHMANVFVDDERSVLAVRDGDFALTVRVLFDVVLEYFYVTGCQWYRSDLSRAAADEVPDSVRDRLLQRLHTLLR
jgi:hypothetical protein